MSPQMNMAVQLLTYPSEGEPREEEDGLPFLGLSWKEMTYCHQPGSAVDP